MSKSGTPLVAVGDVLDLADGDYFIGSGPFDYGGTKVRVRVKHVPVGAAGWRGDWLSMLVVEVLAGGRDGRDLSMIVHRRALLGDRPPATAEAPPTGQRLHIPLRPGWQCAGCETAWPCETAKIDLLAGYRSMRLSLSLYLAGLYIEAMNDLYVRANDSLPPDPRALFERFLGWGNPPLKGDHHTR
jgi:hypothetical protein